MDSTLIGKLDLIAEEFGGYPVVKNLLSERDLEYIASFPGQILVVPVWTLGESGFSESDLRGLGYIPGQKYHVLDRRGRRLYSSYSYDGLFGESEADRRLVFQSRNGEYYHLKVESNRADTLALLWVVTEFSPAQVQSELEFLREQERARVKPRLNYSELFIDTKDLSYVDGNLRLFIKTGQWEEGLTPKNLFDDNSIAVITANVGEQIRLRLSENLWFMVVQGRKVLELVEIEGLIGERLRRSPTGTYYYSNTGKLRSRLRPGQNQDAVTLTGMAKLRRNEEEVQGIAEFVTELPSVYTNLQPISGVVEISQTLTQARVSIFANQLQIAAGAGNLPEPEVDIAAI